MKKLNDFNPISVYAKNDHNLYVGISESINQIDVNEISHVRGHQDKEGHELTHIKKLNVLVDKLETRAIEELDVCQLEWNPEIGPILEIDGISIAKKKECF